MTAWGTGSWGTGAWGGLAAASLALANARATSERTLEVTLTIPPLAAGVLGAGDARNPATWNVYRVRDKRPYIVLAARQLGSSLRWELYTLRKLDDFGTTVRLDAGALRDAGGAAIVAPSTWDLPGCAAAAAPRPPFAELVDLENTPAGDGELVGALRVAAGGDYANQSGPALVRKLIIRRFTTRPGAFRHLPAYGVGFGVKEVVPEAELPRLQAQLERQVSEEPEVVRARVTLTLAAGGVLYARVQAKLRGVADPVDVELPLNAAGSGVEL